MSRLKLATRRLIAAACLVATASASAGPPASTNAPVRRVFVPSDAIESVLPLTGPLVEIGEEDYRRLIDHAAGGATLLEAWIREATHRLVESHSRRRVSGVSRFVVERTPAAGADAVLPLSPMNVQVESASWIDRPDEPVSIGYWHGGQGQPLFGVGVPRSGLLEVVWSASVLPVSASAGSASTEYVLSLPQSPRAALEIDLPEGREPEIDGAARIDARADESPQAAWRFALAPAAAYRLRLSDSGDARRQPACRWNSSSRFTIGRGGVHGEHVLRARWKDDIEGAVGLSVRGEARLVGVEYSSAEGERSPAPHGAASAQVRLPSGVGGAIVCRTISPLVLGEPLELPAVLITGGEWTEGSTALELEDGLRLVDLEAQDATLVAEPSSPSNGAGSLVSAVHHTPSARLSILVGPEQPAFAARSVSRIDIGSIESSGTLVSEITAPSGPLFEIDGNLAADWVIESVETEPASTLRSWQSQNGRLSLILSEPLNAGDRITVRAEGRLPASWEYASPTARELRLCEWDSDTLRAQALIVDRDRELLPHGEDALESTLLSEQGYTASFGSVEPISSGQQAIDLSALPADQPVSLGSTPPAYSVESVCHIECGEEYRYRYQSQVTPKRGSLSELVFRFQRPLPEDAQFYLESDGETIEAAPAVTEDSQGTPSYTLSIPADLLAPYVLRIDCSEPAQTHDVCNPIRFPIAASQQCWVAVRAPSDSVVVSPGGAVAAPVPESGADDEASSPPLVAALRLPQRWFWDPRVLPTIVPSEDVNSLAGEGPHASASVEHHAVFLAEGRVLHRVEYRAEPGQNTPSDLRLPENASDAWIEAEGETRQPVGVAQGKLSLPRDEGQTELIVGFETPLPVSWGGATLDTREAAEVSYLGKRRVVAWAPPGYAASLESHPGGSSAWDRIVGPFAGLAGKSSLPSAGLEQPPAFPGWKAYEFAFVTAPGPIVFYRDAEAMTPSWVAAVAAAAAGATLLRVSARARAALVVTASAALMFCPPGWLWLAHPLFIGTLLGTACACWAGVGGRPSRAAPAVSSTVSTACLLVVALLTAAECRATESTAVDGAAVRAPVVVFPYDRVHSRLGAPLASEAAVRRIADSFNQRSGGPFGFVVLNADYAGDAETGEWRCVWDIDCKDIRGRVPLGINRRDAEWSTTVLVAGVAQKVRWNEAGDRCQLAFPGPGRYRVELQCRFPRDPAVGFDGFELSVPPAPKAEVRLQNLPPSADVRGTADGLVVQADQSGSARLRMGHTGRVAISIAGQTTPTDDGEAEELTALCWLRIGPRGVRLEVFEGTTPAPGIILPKLRTPASYQKTSDSEGAESEGIRVFESDRATGVGRIYQPDLSWEGAAPAEVRWAVSCEEGLDYSLGLPVGSTEVRPDAFASDWPGDPLPPDAAFLNTDPGETWQIDVTPHAAEFTADQSTSLLFDRSSAEVDFTAEVDDHPGGLIMHRLEVDPSFELRAASVLLNGSEERIPLRTTRPAPDRINAFLPRQITRSHALRVEGRAAMTGSRFALPGVALLNHPGGTYRLSLSHTKRVRLDCSNVAAPLEFVSAATMERNEAIPLATSQWSKVTTPRPGYVVAEDYRSQFQTLAVLGADEKKEGRLLDLSGVVEAIDGPLEWIVCDPPETWLGLRLAWGGASGTETLPPGTPLLLRLPEPLEPGSRRSFTISAGLESHELSPGDLVARFPDASEQQTYVRVGREQRVLMRTASARGALANLPRTLRGSDDNDPKSQVYRLDTGSQRRQAPPSMGARFESQVGPTLVAAFIDSAGATLTRARALVTSGANDGLELRLPDGAELLRLEVGGVLAPRSAEWATRVRVQVQPLGVPRSVEVWYRLPPEAGLIGAPLWYQDQQRVPDSGFLWAITSADTGHQTTESVDDVHGAEGWEGFENDWNVSAKPDTAKPLLLASEWPAWQQEMKAPRLDREELEPVFGGETKRQSNTSAGVNAERPGNASSGGASGRIMLLLLVAAAAGLHARFRWTDALLAALLLPGLLALAVVALAALPLSTAEALLAAAAAICIVVQLAAAGPPLRRAQSGH